ncbi:glycoside hydrolase family 140 protein [Clostridium swellfunianum]|uniref:glycoside hydrolase family 140 protein n=1 Tax=Clostridium swellfunianum TaxID=1367462 RepID=UPI002030BFF8|nr:glycoside hydrolase family 140 protein [Clostridium swellfunianum]MCM0647602.1 glycoside hydrolase family 140 protein [Clostridium swellfunianum]
MEKILELKISDNKRFIVKEDGSPFFWLGDTAWELFHKLSREEAELYLQNRAEKEFNVIQAVALAEFYGLEIANAYGRKPLLKNSKGEYDPAMPDICVEGENKYTYWDHMDYIIDKAASLGLYIALLPTWGDKFNKCDGKGPEIFNAENARVYGKWLGERYKYKKNIIWILGGDRYLTTTRHFDVINEMARGIREGDNGKHLMTFHTAGERSSAYHLHDEQWLDFNMIQSGHGSLNLKNYLFVSEDYLKEPIKPTFDGEPRYEDFPISFKAENGFFDDFDVRQATYWALFAGAFGHTYGHSTVWCMCTEPDDFYIMDWKTALDRPGAGQMKYARALIESRTFLDMIPDQDLIAENYSGASHLQAARGKDYAYIYSPNGLPIKVNMGRISGCNIKAQWYNPRNGKFLYIDQYSNDGVQHFTAPSNGRNNDWILILDDSTK